MKPRYLVALMLVIVGVAAVLSFRPQEPAPQGATPGATPQNVAEAFQRDRRQLALRISAAHAGIDHQLRFAVTLTNVSDSDVFVATPTTIPQREADATFFLQVQPLTLSLFGIFPTETYDSTGAYRLAPGGAYTTEWRGSFREVLNGLVVPVDEQRSGEYLVRATYRGRCPKHNGFKFLCNTVTSEWVKLQIQS